MHCDSIREAYSARLDGEDPPPDTDPAEVDAHLAACPACRGWTEAAEALHPRARIRGVDAVDDRTEAILAGVPLTARPIAAREGVRYALMAVALTQLVLAVPALLALSTPGVEAHLSREMGAFELALAVGLLSAAWRPRLAPGLLPFAAALAAAVVFTAVTDVVGGSAGAGTEAHHVLDLAGVALLWFLPVRPRRLGRGPARDAHAPARSGRVAPA